LVLNKKEFLGKCGQEDRVMKEAWEGRDLAEGDVI
jgi:hypothetical protein